MRLLAPVLLVAAVPVFGPPAIHHERHLNENPWAGVASRIAGREVEVHCPGTLEKLVEISPHPGSVYFDGNGQPADYTELNDATCSTLDDFAEGNTDAADSLRVAPRCTCSPTVRSVPTRFVVAPRHQDDELERIVELHTAFVVVEKVHDTAGYPASDEPRRRLATRGARPARSLWARAAGRSGPAGAPRSRRRRPSPR